MIFGYKFNKDGTIKGENDTLRYSGFSLWCKNKDAYRNHYYKGVSLHTPETVFGSVIHKLMEDPEEVQKHPILSKVLRYETSEYNIEVPFENFKIGGCLDSFRLETFSFLDYKSSHLSKDGKVPWDKVKVAKHDQMPFYSLLIEEKHGEVDPYCHLIWIETAFKNKTKEFEGHILSTQSRDLELTGHFETFKRRIAQWERDLMRKRIKQAAQEINDDFINWKKQNDKN